LPTPSTFLTPINQLQDIVNNLALGNVVTQIQALQALENQLPNITTLLTQLNNITQVRTCLLDV
jgi:hypothetical protein